MGTISVVINDVIRPVDITTFNEQNKKDVLPTDVPYYIRIVELNPYKLKIFYMFHEEEKATYTLGKTKVEIGKVSGKLYSYSSEVGVNETGFADPQKFKDYIKNSLKNQKNELGKRFLNNLNYSVSLAQFVIEQTKEK
ncbi:MAG: hypothetical protein IK025_00575 [Bacteroidales bacterium]|nr:hypothetical protein [Bacteroidales bacterium]